MANASNQHHCNVLHDYLAVKGSTRIRQREAISLAAKVEGDLRDGKVDNKLLVDTMVGTADE